jgi:hypothetical protein
MTAITIVRGDNAIAIASDGAAYDDTGKLIQIVPKVDLFPDLSLVTASTGSGLALNAFRNLLFWHNPLPLNFDEVLIAAPGISLKMMDFIKHHGAPSTHKFSLYLCGWSNERQRTESYGIKSYDWPGVVDSAGKAFTAPAFTLVPLPAIHCAPRPPADIAGQFGIKVPGVNLTEMPAEGTSYALAAVASCRFAMGGADHEIAQADPFVCVGGFLQLTTLAREHIASQIVHRWPDVLGERMDMNRGADHEKAPLWLLKPPQDERDE